MTHIKLLHRAPKIYQFTQPEQRPLAETCLVVEKCLDEVTLQVREYFDSLQNESYELPDASGLKALVTKLERIVHERVAAHFGRTVLPFLQPLIFDAPPQLVPEKVLAEKMQTADLATLVEHTCNQAWDLVFNSLPGLTGELLAERLCIGSRLLRLVDCPSDSYHLSLAAEQQANYHGYLRNLEVNLCNTIKAQVVTQFFTIYDYLFPDLSSETWEEQDSYSMA